jgi:hypothetical protein
MCRLRVTRIPNTLFLDCHAKIELRSIGPDRFQNPRHGSLASPERQGRPPDEGPVSAKPKNGQRADVINKRKLAELCTALSEDRVDESTSRNIGKAEPTSRRKLCPACSAADGDTGASMASGDSSCSACAGQTKRFLVVLVFACRCVAASQDAEPAVVIYPRRAAGAGWV